MDEVDEHLRNLKETIEKIRTPETENFTDRIEKPRNTQTENLKEIIQKLRNLQSERQNLLLEIEELKRLANAKASALDNEVAALREELMALKDLVNMSETSMIDQRIKRNTATKRSSVQEY